MSIIAVCVTIITAAALNVHPLTLGGKGKNQQNRRASQYPPVDCADESPHDSEAGSLNIRCVMVVINQSFKVLFKYFCISVKVARFLTESLVFHTHKLIF